MGVDIIGGSRHYNRDRYDSKLEKEGQLAFKINRTMKISLMSVIVVLLLVGAGTVSLLFMAKGAANDFRADATQQLNNVIDGKDSGAAVELRSVWFGRTLSSDYRKVDSLQGEYQKLLVSLKNYVVTLDTHNQLVGKYNSGLKGEDVLNGDFLKLTNKYRDLIASKFPDETERITAMDDLVKAMAGSSDFDSISSSLAGVISDNDDWLNQVRDDLNSQIAAFQKKIN